jgi:hypothetical protein
MLPFGMKQTKLYLIGEQIDMRDIDAAILFAGVDKLTESLEGGRL